MLYVIASGPSDLPLLVANAMFNNTFVKISSSSVLESGISSARISAWFLIFWNDGQYDEELEFSLNCSARAFAIFVGSVNVSVGVLNVRTDIIAFWPEIFFILVQISEAFTVGPMFVT